MKDVSQPDFATPDKQEARSFLRERFLRAIKNITDKECILHLYDKSEVKGTFGGTDMNVLKLYVKDLSSPGFEIPHALVRTTDILSIKVPKASYQKLLNPQEQIDDGQNEEGQSGDRQNDEALNGDGQNGDGQNGNESMETL